MNIRNSTPDLHKDPSVDLVKGRGSRRRLGEFKATAAHNNWGTEPKRGGVVTKEWISVLDTQARALNCDLSHWHWCPERAVPTPRFYKVMLWTQNVSGARQSQVTYVHVIHIHTSICVCTYMFISTHMLDVFLFCRMWLHLTGVPCIHSRFQGGEAPPAWWKPFCWERWEGSWNLWWLFTPTGSGAHTSVSISPLRVAHLAQPGYRRAGNCSSITGKASGSNNPLNRMLSPWLTYLFAAGMVSELTPTNSF